MYSLTYSAKYGWSLWVDSNIGPMLIKQGSFKYCWNMRTFLALRKKGVIGLMMCNEWLTRYKEAMCILSIIDNVCPFIKDDSVSCESCKIEKECKFVIKICDSHP